MKVIAKKDSFMEDGGEQWLTEGKEYALELSGSYYKFKSDYTASTHQAGLHHVLTSQLDNYFTEADKFTEQQKQAVIALDGVWPNTVGDLPEGYPYDPNDMGTDCKKSPSSVLYHISGMNKELFMQCRAELENKPKWEDCEHDYIAQDECGEWWNYCEEPFLDDAASWCNDGATLAIEIGKGHCFGDWRDSLEKRPKDQSYPSKEEQEAMAEEVQKDDIVIAVAIRDAFFNDNIGDKFLTKGKEYHLKSISYKDYLFSSDKIEHHYLSKLDFNKYFRERPQNEQRSMDVDDVASSELEHTTWNGEGLPPVGFVCEATWGNKAEWFKSIRLDESSYATYYEPAEKWDVRYDNADFRPIRTAEEIEREELSLMLWRTVNHNDESSDSKILRSRRFRITC